jgi:hypothetical protein
MSDHDAYGTGTPPLSMGETAKKLRLGLFIVLGVLVALNIFIRSHDPHFVIDWVPGFWAVFGVMVAIVLGRAAKGAAHTFLGKDEDFWA